MPAVSRHRYGNSHHGTIYDEVDLQVGFNLILLLFRSAGHIGHLFISIFFPGDVMEREPGSKFPALTAEAVVKSGRGRK